MKEGAGGRLKAGGTGASRVGAQAVAGPDPARLAVGVRVMWTPAGRPWSARQRLARTLAAAAKRESVLMKAPWALRRALGRAGACGRRAMKGSAVEASGSRRATAAVGRVRLATKGLPAGDRGWCGPG